MLVRLGGVVVGVVLPRRRRFEARTVRRRRSIAQLRGGRSSSTSQAFARHAERRSRAAHRHMLVRAARCCGCADVRCIAQGRLVAGLESRNSPRWRAGRPRPTHEQLRDAITRRSSSCTFTLDAARTGKSLGVEALIRRPHPEHGVVSRYQVLTARRRAGLIRPLTDLVLEAALARCPAWRAGGAACTSR